MYLHWSSTNLALCCSFFFPWKINFMAFFRGSLTLEYHWGPLLSIPRHKQCFLLNSSNPTIDLCLFYTWWHLKPLFNEIFLLLARNPLRQGRFQYSSKTAIRKSTIVSITNPHIPTIICGRSACFLWKLSDMQVKFPLFTKFWRTYLSFLNCSVFKVLCYWPLPLASTFSKSSCSWHEVLMLFFIMLFS